jgi:hypothetical protein
MERVHCQKVGFLHLTGKEGNLLFLTEFHQADSKYFTMDESKETVSKFSKYNPTA